MPLLHTTGKEPWKDLFKQIERPLAGVSLIQPEGMSKFMEVGDSRQSPSQRNGTRTSAIAAVVAGLAVDPAETQCGPFAENLTEVGMEGSEFGFPFVDCSPPRVGSLETVEGIEDFRAKNHGVVDDFSYAIRVVRSIAHTLYKVVSPHWRLGSIGTNSL